MNGIVFEFVFEEKPRDAPMVSDAEGYAAQSRFPNKVFEETSSSFEMQEEPFDRRIIICENHPKNPNEMIEICSKIKFVKGSIQTEEHDERRPDGVEYISIRPIP